MTPEVERVREAAAAFRPHLAERCARWKAARGMAVGPGAPATKDMCRGAAHALARVLEATVGGAWGVVGGWSDLPDPEWEDFVDTGAMPGGMVDRTGRWRGHYWAASQPDPSDPEAPRIFADVAADQFGHEAVVVAFEGDPRYRANLWEQTLDEELGAGARYHGDRWAEDYLETRPGMAPPAAAPGMAA